MSSSSIFAFERLRGLDREPLLAVIAPVLRGHGVVGVELIWRTDTRGLLLEMTVEREGSRDAGAGVTLDECAELARDLSAALDTSDVIAPAYRLEVGTPGLERALYGLGDYQRFVDHLVRVKLDVPVLGEKTLRGRLLGADDAGTLRVATDAGEIAVEFSNVVSGRLVLDTEKLGLGGGSRTPRANRRRGRSAQQHR